MCGAARLRSVHSSCPRHQSRVRSCFYLRVARKLPVACWCTHNSKCVTQRSTAPLRHHFAESILVVRHVGVQRCVYNCAGWRTVKFIPAEDIVSVVVNEGITRCDVRYYLALVVTNRPRMELLFAESRPALGIVARAYRAMTATLGSGTRRGCTE